MAIKVATGSPSFLRRLAFFPNDAALLFCQPAQS
jgi:hypothetical protein